MCATSLVDPETTRLVCSLPGGSEHARRIRLEIHTHTHTPQRHRNHAGAIAPPATLTIVGELDGPGVSVVADQCCEFVATVHDLAVDVSGVTLIDSAGVRLLEQLRDVGGPQRGRVWLLNPSPIVQRVIAVLEIPFDTAPGR